MDNSLGSEVVNTTCEQTVVPDVFSEARTGLWFVLHTKPQQEKILADTLNAMEMAGLSDHVESGAYYGRRRIALEKPLFRRYLFLRGSLEEAGDATSYAESSGEPGDRRLAAGCSRFVWRLNRRPHLGKARGEGSL